MIQRIQTVYLLFVVGLLVASLCLPLSYFTDGESATYTLTPFEINSANVSYSTWGLCCILILGVFIAIASIYLYKNRRLQMRMTVFNILMLLGFYLVFAVFYYVLRIDLHATVRLHWSLSLPLVAIILNCLAYRAIRKDEQMVKAADRLR